ncbi:MAG: NBR1-Ig-like domain-containing protein [Chloroflexota bacterium]
MFIKRSYTLVLLLSLVLAACGLPAAGTPTAVNYIQTAAAGTVIAELTQAATKASLPTLTLAPVQATATAPASTSIDATATATVFPPPLPTNTLAAPANTLPPTAVCDRATFVKDITYPDDTEVAKGETFVKTWRIKNNGTCTWNSSYSVVFDEGDAMLPPGSAASFQLTTGTVAPGQEIDLSVTLQAPDKTGSYEGFWMLRNGNGVLFGIGAQAEKAFWVKVKVIDKTTPTPSASVQFDLIAKAPNAEWRNATSTLPWGDRDDDTPGVVTDLENVKLNDGKTHARVLATYPQRVTDGVIYGVFPAYTVQEKDHFKASLGFRSPCDAGNVKFQLRYRDGASEVSLGEWLKSCDGKLQDIDLDLAALKGKSIQFMLVVTSNGAWEDDKAVWLAPRVEH